MKQLTRKDIELIIEKKLEEYTLELADVIRKFDNHNTIAEVLECAVHSKAK